MFDNDATEENNTKRMIVKYVIPGLGILAVLSIVFAGSVYLATSYPNVLGTDSDTNSQTGSNPEEVEKLIDKVSELILLPQGETPSVATVNDLSQVRSQDFFRNAKVGDKVIIYSAAKKAYLYRPDTHKLIEVGIVSQGTPGEGDVQNAQPEIVSPTPIPTTPIETPVVTPINSPTDSVLVTPEPSPTQ